MARSFYTEYVNHCMRFYTRYSYCAANSVQELNWQACKKALSDFSPEEQEILTFVYRERDAMSDNVYNISKEKKINQSTVWNLIGKLELKVAKIRGLI